MAVISKFLRKTDRGYAHWCPGCKELHQIYTSWKYNNNPDCPTFSQSIKITGVQVVKVDGRWTGEWVLDANEKAKPECCHYTLINGVLNYLPDCTHELRGFVNLPELPEFAKDIEI